MQKLLVNQFDVLILFVFLSIPQHLFSQKTELFLTTFIGEAGLTQENAIEKYLLNNFAGCWTHTENHLILGVIGDDNERIRIKLLAVERDSMNPAVYNVTGKSRVKDNICDFSGNITIEEIREVEKLPRAILKEYKSRKIRNRGIVIASYKFDENPGQDHRGIFRGRFYSKWYLDSVNLIRYDDLNITNEKYSNNAFLGVWEMYGGGLLLKCNWADFRIPDATDDLDVGTERFIPARKYFSNGWESYIKAYTEGNQEALRAEFYHWWK